MIVLTEQQRLVCERVINVFETGSPGGNYGAISIYHDGPHGIRQVTYGRSQTTEYGNLGKLVRMYADAGGVYSADLAPFVDMIGHVPLVDNDTFKSLLRKAGREDPVMQRTQDGFFDEVYFTPALNWANANGFTLALSILVIYDSYIHSGRILKLLRSRFAQLPPAQGGDERAWIGAYVAARDDWLRHNENPAVRPSAYRTADLLREIANGNWNLDHLPISANGTPVDAGNAFAAPAPVPAHDVPFFGPVIASGPATPSGAVAGPLAVDEAGLRALAAQAGVSPAMERLIVYRNRFRTASNPRYWAVVDFDRHSANPRLFVFDRVAGAMTRHLCAHGKGSDRENDGRAKVFSNEDGSNCSSLGIYLCGDTYVGQHGRSLYLDGLEDTNSNARARHIVVHGASYVSQATITKTGRIGRSLGCPAVPNGEAQTIIDRLERGSLLIAWQTPS